MRKSKEKRDVRSGRTGWYDPALLDVVTKARGAQAGADIRQLPIADLRPEMILAQDVRNRQGTLFAARGQEVTRGLIEKLKIFVRDLPDAGWIRVVVPAPQGVGRPRPAC